MAIYGQGRPDAGALQLGAVLGDLLTGGPGRRASANEPQRLKQNFDAFKAYEDARISRAQANAREGLTAEIVQQALSGDQAALGELGAVTMRMAAGQPNFGTFTSGVEDVATMTIDRDIREALESGNLDGARRLSAVKNDKVLPELGAGGDVVFSPVDGAVQLTPLGESQLSLEAARAGQANAAATRSLRAPAARAAAAPKRMPVQELRFHVERLEEELGRKLTSPELNDLALGRFNVSVPAAAGEITEGGGSTPTPVKTEAEYRALPSGSRFVAPDGTIRVKP